EAAFVSKGESVFAGKMGTPIASAKVSAVDDATLPNAWGSGNMDDEGSPTRRNLLIENGVLKSYLVDRLSALRMGGASNGAGRRQSYRYAPTSRMSNTYILPGNDDEDEMLSTMGDGLYCKKMGGGSVNVQTSEFNFSVSEAYLVRGGKIDRPVRGATLIGKGSEILHKIDRVGGDFEAAQGMCGAASGNIPADVGQPTLRVSEITVGGQKGE
ncbi:MAG: TldD/PmbA family protein, partial [Eubacteriales bacterium]|nr:TldD/PmbA family protein [Eubacteriales bacterium]